MDRWWFVVFLLFFAACRGQLDERQYEPLILDDAALLDPATVHQLTSAAYPRGFAFIVRSVQALPPAGIGAAADALFEADAKRCPDPKACARRGVFILVSQVPALVQVRTGSDIAVQARWGGVTAGREYLARQRPKPDGSGPAVTTIAAWLSVELPRATQLTWFRRWLLVDLTQNLYLELDKLSLPSEAFYGHYLLRPFLHASIFAQRVSGSWWPAYVVAAGIALVVGAALRWLIKRLAGPGSGKIASSLGTVASIAVKLTLAVPSVASAVLLSGARLEDQIALRASGIAGAESFAFPAASMTVPTGIALALLLLVLRLGKGIAEGAWLFPYAGLPDETQRQCFDRQKKESPLAAWIFEAASTEGDSDKSRAFEQAPFEQAELQMLVQSFWSGIRWGLLGWAFLPEVLSWTAICFWIVPAVTGVLRVIPARATAAGLRRRSASRY